MSKINELELLLTKGKINRREFIARLSALGFSAALSPAMFAGSARAATPQKGGRLRIGMSGGSTTDSLNPATATDSMMQVVGPGVLRNCLTEIDHNGKIIPELAESWKASADAVQWTFKLRKNVEFHNGKTLDADDVVFSFNLHRGKDSKSAAKALVDAIKEIKTDGKQVVIFNMKSGNADFPYILSDYHLQIVPNGTTDFSKGIGTGGYSLVSFEPGVSLLAKRNPNYWKAGRAHFDEIYITVITDPQARISALQSGQVDVINRVELKVARMLGRVPKFQIIEAKYGRVYYFPMLTDVPPFDNNNVRLALKYAIDRNDMVKRILHGYGSPGNDNPFTPMMPFHDSKIPTREYDPDKAKFYIKKAGLKDYSFPLHVADAGFPGAVDAAILYKEYAAKAGINIKVIREPNDGYWSNIWMKKPWCASYVMSRPTPDMVLTLLYAEDAPWNDSHWKHKRFNTLLKQARTELNNDKRKGMYTEIQHIISDEGGVILPMMASTVEAASIKLKYENYTSIWEFDGLKLPEKWWFES